MSLGAAAKNRSAFARESLKSWRYTSEGDTSTFEGTRDPRERKSAREIKRANLIFVLNYSERIRTRAVLCVLR